MSRANSYRALALLVASLATALAVAQETPKPLESKGNASAGIAALLDNVDVLVDNYANFVSRKYALTPEQDTYARALIRERAHDFLDKHDEKMRTLLDTLFEVRGGKNISQDELKEWGREIMPIYQDAKHIIVTSNNEFRSVLTEEQLKIHDEDLKLANETFSTTEDQLRRVVSGEMTLEEFRNPNLGSKGVKHSKPPTQTVNPVRPVTPNSDPTAAPSDQPTATPMTPEHVNAGGDTRVTKPAGENRTPAVKPSGPVRNAGRNAKAGSADFEGEWDKYVREFNETYELNDEQRQQSQTILDDCKTQAQKYVSGNKAQIDAVEAKEAEARKSTDKDKSKTLADLTQQKQKLLEPLTTIFEKQLKPRLEKIPTRAQRKAAEEAKAKPKPGAKVPAKPDAKPGTAKPDKPGEPAEPTPEPPASQPQGEGEDQ